MGTHLTTRSVLLYDDKPSSFKVQLPITSSGLVHEIIHIPTSINELFYKDAESLVTINIKIKPIDLIEKTWRMAYRVFNTFNCVSKKQRNLVGLTTWKCITNITEAYKISSEFRWKVSERDWLAINHQNYINDKSNFLSEIDRFALTPQFYILLNEYMGDDQGLLNSLNSLNNQFYKYFTCIILSHSSSKKNLAKLNMLIEHIGYQSVAIAKNARGPWLKKFNESINNRNHWVIFMSSGESLPPHSLYRFAKEINMNINLDVIYSDDAIQLAPSTFESPRFKPDFSIEHIHSTNFIGNAIILNGRLVHEADGISLESIQHNFFELLLRSIDKTKNKSKRVHHLPSVLFYRSAHNQALTESQKELNWYKKSIKSHLARNKIAANVITTHKNCFRVIYKLPSTLPLVSIIIPTRNCLQLLKQSVSSILKNTSYRNYELLIIDHESMDPEVIEYFKEISKLPNIKIMGFKGPFNFSAMNNRAEQQSTGEIICLLNNDTEVISSDWLDEMVGHLLQDKVGVVGAKLLYPNNLVQHAGDTVGPGGCANHLHSLIARDDPGYCNRAIVAQELSAVTAACLITWRKIYQDLGGFNEKRLKVAFNDVDYCLRVREAGYKVVWTPHAELYHHESMTRGKDLSLRKKWYAYREVKYMRKKWVHIMHNDPYYNINFTYENANFQLSHYPTLV